MCRRLLTFQTLKKKNESWRLYIEKAFSSKKKKKKSFEILYVLRRIETKFQFAYV